MAEIETVYIHHDDLDAESQVPPHTVATWVASGWVEGPLERRQAERDAEQAVRLAAAKVNADATARAAALVEARDAGDIVLAAELSGEPLVNLDKLPPLPPKGGDGSSVEHWRKYAKKIGVDLADDLNRGEVIAVIEAAIARSEALAAAVETSPTGDTPEHPEEG